MAWQKIVLGSGTSSQYIKGDGTFGTYEAVGLGDDNTFTGDNTFSGAVKITSSSADTTLVIQTTSGTTIFPVLDFKSSHSSVGGIIKQDGDNVITFDNSQNATFAGSVTVSNQLLVNYNSTSVLGNLGNAHASGYGLKIRATDGTSSKYITTFNDKDDNVKAQILGDGSATFTGDVLIKETTDGYATLTIRADGSPYEPFLKLETGGGNAVAGMKAMGTTGEVMIGAFGSQSTSYFPKIYSANAVALSFDTSQNATFAGDVLISKSTTPKLTIKRTAGSQACTLEFENEWGTTIGEISSEQGATHENGMNFKVGNGATTALTLSGTSVGNATFSGDVRVGGAGKTLLLDVNGGNIEWLSEGGTRRGEIASHGDGIQFYTGQSSTEIFSLPIAGTHLSMIGSSDILWETDNVGDIGASGATRPRDLHLGRNAVIGGTIGSGAITSTAGISGTTGTFTGDIATNSTTHAYMRINSSATTTASWNLHSQGGNDRWLAGVEGSQTKWQLYNLSTSPNATRFSVDADASSLVLTSSGATFAGTIGSGPITATGHSTFGNVGLTSMWVTNLIDGNSADNAMIVFGHTSKFIKFYTDGETSSDLALTLDSSHDATFGGHVIIPEGKSILSNHGDRRIVLDEGTATGRAASWSAYGDIKFLTYSDSSYNEKVRIKADGNVGIGTAAPKYAGLHIHNGTDGNLALTSEADEARILSMNDADNAYKPLKYYGSEHNFLVGNATFAGDVAITGGSTTALTIGDTTGDTFQKMVSASASGIQLQLWHGGTQTATINSNTTNIFSVYDGSSGGTNVFNIADGGNATFAGTLTSIGQFTVLNDAPQVVIKSTDTSNGDATLSLISDNGATNEDYWKIKAVSPDDELQFLNGNDASCFTLNSSGNATFGGTVLLPNNNMLNAKNTSGVTKNLIGVNGSNLVEIDGSGLGSTFGGVATFGALATFQGVVNATGSGTNISEGLLWAKGGVRLTSSFGETLDSYEEGSWTPTLPANWSCDIITANTRYVKIGALVTLWANLGNVSAVSGDFLVQGLPFTVKHNAVGGDVMMKSMSPNSKSNNISCYTNTSEHIFFYETASAYAWDKVDGDDVSGADEDIYFSIQYETDD